MQLPLHLFLAAIPLSSAYLIHHPSSLIAHQRSHHHQVIARTHQHQQHSSSSSSTRLYYQEPSKSYSSDDTSSDSNNVNVWSVLANTERWISDTLDKSNKAENARLDGELQKQQQQREREAEAEAEEAAKKKEKAHFMEDKEETSSSSSKKKESLPRVDNPYARKEVSYVCETGGEVSGVVGGIFRRVREARELGESHGRGVEARLGDSSQPTTMRQTNVVVMPNCDDLSKFHAFDKLVQAINQARRASRDFVLKKKEDGTDGKKDWIVSINCAHLHPEYGTVSPEEQLEQLKREESEGEVDPNLQEFKKRRDEARRSPYPSVIIEVQSTPPPDFGSRRDALAVDEAASEMAIESTVDKDVTSEDVKKLEALFGMGAAKKSSSSVNDPFYDALGEAFKNNEIVTQTPLSRAQNWVLDSDQAFNELTSTFTNSNTRHVDAAYEYIFNNLAMLIAADDATRGQKSYVVLPNFVPTSATSFDRFAGQVSNIIRAMPSLADKVMVSTFHPEHVVKSTQSPVPIVVITWK